MIRVARWLCAMLGLGLTACAAQPEDRLTWRESWELILITGKGQIVDARVAVGNTGLLKGQGHLRFDRWVEGGAAINFGTRSAPSQTGVWAERERVRIGGDLLDLERQNWTLRVQSDEANAVVHLAPTSSLQVTPATAPAPGGRWTVAATLSDGRATGWVEAGERGGAIDGRGVLLYRGGDGVLQGPRRTLILQGGDASIGYDGQGDFILAWLHLDGQALDASGAGLVETSDGWMLSFPAADVTVALRGRNVGGVTDIRSDALPPGKLILQAARQPLSRSVQAVQGTVVGPGNTQILPGALVQVADEAERIHIPLRPQKARP